MLVIVLYMDPDWDHLNFLHAASQRLDMVPHASRVFNSDGKRLPVLLIVLSDTLQGVEVDDCMMIEDDDMLFLSQGDSFLIPADLTLPEGTGGPNEILSPIPHIIGGYKVSSVLPPSSHPLTHSRLQVGELLGRGGFGEVRVGEHSLTFDKVALKVPIFPCPALMTCCNPFAWHSFCAKRTSSPWVLQREQTQKYNASQL